MFCPFDLYFFPIFALAGAFFHIKAAPVRSHCLIKKIFQKAGN